METETLTKAVIYSRVSSDHQDYASQISALQNYAKGKYLIVETFYERVSVTRKKGKKVIPREQFDKMKKYVFDNNIKRILMWELSRLSRDTVTSLTEIRYFENIGTGIYFLKEGLDTLMETNKVAIGFMAVIADNESSYIKERVKRGHLNSAERGRRVGLRTLPYGYKSDEKGYLVVDEEEAIVIREIYDLALNGIGYRGIAGELNSRGIKTRWTKLGRINKNVYDQVIPIKWKPNSIGIILNNTLYKGERNYKGEIFQAPQIIEEDKWNKVKEVISKKPGINRKPTKYTYLFKGKVVCGVCGRHYGARTETRYGYERSFYYCNGARDIVLRCKNGEISSKLLEEGVYTALFAHSDRQQQMKEERKSHFNLLEKQNQIEYYTNEINQNLKEVENIKILFRKSLMTSKELDIEIHKINVQNDSYKLKIKTIKNEINEFNSDASDKLSVQYLMTDDPIKRQYFVDKYLNKIVVHRIKKVDISNRDINKKNIEFVTLWEDPENETREWFKRQVLDNTKNHLTFIEIYAFNNTIPLNAILVNDKRKPLKMDQWFVSPSFTINSGVLTLK